MPVGAWLELDLLLQRRERLGVVAPERINQRKLLLRGGAIGGTLLLLVLLTGITFLLLTQLLRDRQRNLQPDASTYDRYLKDLVSTRDLDQKLGMSNQSLAMAIAGLRSGSALLTEVSNLVPQQVQLTKLTVEASGMKISASAPQPLGLDRANQFQLLLESSPFFGIDSVTLVQAIETQSSMSTSISSPIASQSKTSLLSFDLSATFPPGESRLTQGRLLGLRADGLARRLQILNKEGFLK